MTEISGIERAIEMVRREQFNSYQRGMLAFWTIYKCPRDWPQGYIARKHDSGKGGSTPTNIAIQSESAADAALDMICHILSCAGLVRIPRDPNDDVNIVESWV
ncbi:hypothetical protein ABIF78_007760 [Bradyrhizobium japonicum]